LIAILTSERARFVDHLPRSREESFRALLIPETAIERAVILGSSAEDSRCDAPVCHSSNCTIEVALRHIPPSDARSIESDRPVVDSRRRAIDSGRVFSDSRRRCIDAGVDSIATRARSTSS
jgi:hypothetical protein